MYMKISDVNVLANMLNNDPCPICSEPLVEEETINQKEIVAHEGEGLKHPLHLRCLQLYLDNLLKNNLFPNFLCPTCRISVKIPLQNSNWIQKIRNKCGSLTHDLSPLRNAANIQIKDINRSIYFGLSTFYLLAGKVSNLPDQSYNLTGDNFSFFIISSDAISQLSLSENKFGAILGGIIGTALGVAIVASTTSMFIEDDKIDFTENLYDINPFTRLTMMFSPAIGMSIGEYVFKNYFR